MSGSGKGPPTNITEYLICAARDVEASSLPADTDIGSSPLALIAKSYLILVYYSTFIAGSLLNFLLLYLIIRYKKLHTLSFVISLQIVFLDLLQLYGVYLFRLVTVFTGKWVFGTGFCVVTGFIFIFVRVARSFLMCVFVIDCFLSVFAPYFYPRHDKKIAITLSVVAWILALLFQLPAFPGLLDCYSFSVDRFQCIYLTLCNQPCLVYARVYVIVIFIPTTLLPVVLYTLLYLKVKKIKKDSPASVAPVGEENQPVKRNWKSVITFFLLFLTAFVLTAPPSVLLVILAATLSNVPAQAGFVILAFVSSVPSFLVVADPIVIMRHSDVKDVLREIKTKLCGRCGSSSRQDANQVELRDLNPPTTSRVAWTVKQNVSQDPGQSE